MPSVVVSMSPATRDLVLEKKNAKIKPSFIAVDNAVPLTDAVLIFNDVFQTAAAPTVDITVPRLKINVSTLACVSLRDELKDIRFLGKAEVVRSALHADCHITFAYDFE